MTNPLGWASVFHSNLSETNRKNTQRIKQINYNFFQYRIIILTHFSLALWTCTLFNNLPVLLFVNKNIHTFCYEDPTLYLQCSVPQKHFSNFQLYHKWHAWCKASDLMINLLDLRLNDLYLSPDQIHSLFHFWIKGLEIATHWSPMWPKFECRWPDVWRTGHLQTLLVDEKWLFCANRYNNNAR